MSVCYHCLCEIHVIKFIANSADPDQASPSHLTAPDQNCTVDGDDNYCMLLGRAVNNTNKVFIYRV